jgi:hypothetical protein
MATVTREAEGRNYRERLSSLHRFEFESAFIGLSCDLIEPRNLHKISTRFQSLGPKVFEIQWKLKITRM